LVEKVVDCHVTGMPEWHVGADLDTGSAPSIAVQLLARGEITERGALPPEIAIPWEPYFAELAKRRMIVKTETRSWTPTSKEMTSA